MYPWLLFILLLPVEGSNLIMKNLFYVSEGKMRNVTAEFFYSVDNDNFRGPYIWKHNDSIHVFRNIPLRLFFDIKNDELLRILSMLKPFPEEDLPAFLMKHKEKVDLKQLRIQKEKRMGTIIPGRISLEEEELYLRQMAKFSNKLDSEVEDHREALKSKEFMATVLYACFLIEITACGMMLVMAMFLIQAYYRSRHRFIRGGSRRNHNDSFIRNRKKLLLFPSQ